MRLTLTRHGVSDSSQVHVAYLSHRQELMAHLLVSLSAHCSDIRSVRWYPVLILAWSMLWPVTGIEFTPRVFAESGPANPANHPALNQAKRLINADQAEEALTILRRFLTTSPKPD